MAPAAAAKRKPAAEAAAAKAKQTAAKLKKPKTVKNAKVRYNVHFFRPKTRSQPRNPKYPRISAEKPRGFDPYKVIKSPLATEVAMKKVEEINTLVLLCNPMSTKPQIKQAVKVLYGVKAKKVNTLIRPDGVKKAFVRLTNDYDALDVASKIGLL